jgi:hypothetical protein
VSEEHLMGPSISAYLSIAFFLGGRQTARPGSLRHSGNRGPIVGTLLPNSDLA